MPPLSRRAMLKAFAGGATLSAAAPLITACSNGSSSSPETNSTATPDSPPTPPGQPTQPTQPTQTADFTDLTGFDYPIIESLLPFAHGVASGDPMQDRVIIWTRITIPDPRGWEVTDPQGISEVMVDWLIATDPDLTNVVNRGTTTTSAARDFTVKVDANLLQPATTYYYAFAALGETSVIGRTRTAPAMNSSNSELRFAVAACSSYWSSFWSGYGHIADRNDLDLVIHVGDYIYDFVDQDEEVRARVDRDGDAKDDITDVDYRDWLNKNECRRRYALFRSEPNHLRAHQQHPWTIVWDNHDLDPGFGNELDDNAVDRSGENTRLDDTVDVFWEWTPCRPPINADGDVLTVNDGSYPEPPLPRQVWRKLDYGALADLLCLDIELYRQESDADRPADFSDHLVVNGAESLLGMEQYNFITQQMLASKNDGKTWRVLPHQTWLAPWGIPQATADQNAPDSPIQTRWSDFSEERTQWFEFLRNNSIHNNIVLSGDMHGNWASDLIEDNSTASTYQSAAPLANPRSGSRLANANAGFGRVSTNNTAVLNNRALSVGVEFAPTSMGRGGADELVANANPGSTEADQVAGARAIEQASIQGNKNVQFKEWVDHGYGIVHLTADEAIFEFWWQDKLTEGSPDVLGFQMVSFASTNTAATQVPPQYQNQIDDVTLFGRTVAETSGSRTDQPAPTPNDPLTQT